MNTISNQFLSIEQLQDKYLNRESVNTAKKTENSISFRDIMEEKTGNTLQGELSQGSEIRFSKHASSRLATRDIELDNSQVERLQQGVERAHGKGIKDSLVIMDSLAFIVNVPSATVITAMDRRETADNIFTNIDGAVIV